MNLIVHSEKGIYLGNCLGLGFWSELDPAGQDHAVCFSSIEEAKNHIRSWENENNPQDYLYPEIESSKDFYASLDDCEKAGLERWVP